MWIVSDTRANWENMKKCVAMSSDFAGNIG